LQAEAAALSRAASEAVKIINRCALSVAPRPPFLAWAQQRQAGRPLPAGATAQGLYLIDAYESREEAWRLLEQGYEQIFSAELQAWSTDPATWPSPRSLALFQQWFEVQFYDLVGDQSQHPLQHYELDDSLLLDLRGLLKSAPAE